MHAVLTLKNCKRGENSLQIQYIHSNEKTCPKGFGLKLTKLGLKIPRKNKVKQKQS